MIRILHVVGRMNRGGVETWLMHVLRNIDRNEFRMDFLVHSTEPGAYDDEIRALGSKVIPCPDPRRLWTYARNFKRILREHGPYDVIHSQVFLFSGLVLWLAEQTGVPGRIAHMHPPSDLKGQGIFRRLYQACMADLIARHANLVLVPSQSSLRFLTQLLGSRTPRAKILRNCVDLDRFSREIDSVAVRKTLGLPSTVPLVTYVARFATHKNHMQVFRIADRVNAGEYRAHFVMAGSHGETLTEVRSLARTRRDVSVVVGLPDVSDLLLASDICLFPSLHEGFGVAALEAAAAGLPVVATDLEAVREACPPSHHALMIPPNDDDRGAQSINVLLNDRSLRTRLARDGREWAKQFSIGATVSQLAAMYRQVSESRAARAHSRGTPASEGAGV